MGKTKYATQKDGGDASRGSIWKFPPHKLVVHGEDPLSPEELAWLLDIKGTIVDMFPEELAHPLKYRAHAPIESEFVKSVEELGVIVPVVIAKLPSGRAIVIDGTRRVRAARAIVDAANGSYTKADIVECRDADEKDLLAYRTASNAHRYEDPPSKKADLAAANVHLGIPKETVALWFGKSERTIATWLRIARLHPDVKDALDEEKVTIAKASKWAELPWDEQLEELEKHLNKGNNNNPTGPGLDEPVVKPPPKRTILYVIKHGAESLHPQAFAALKWTRGLESPEALEGFPDLDLD